jgi:hypothetical protein
MFSNDGLAFILVHTGSLGLDLVNQLLEFLDEKLQANEVAASFRNKPALDINCAGRVIESGNSKANGAYTETLGTRGSHTTEVERRIQHVELVKQ